MTIYIHSGAHKTASTFIQELFQVNKEKIESSLIKFYIKPTFDFNSKNLIDICRSTYHEGYEKIVFSDENFIGLMPGNGKLENSFFYQQRIEQFSQVLDEISNIFSLKFLLCVRRQDSYLESCFRFRRKINPSYTMENFMSATENLNVSWFNVVHPVADRIGKNNCIVVPFEIIKKSQEKFLETLLGSILNITQKDFKILPKENQSLSNLSISIIDYINKNSIDIPKYHKRQLVRIIELHRDQLKNNKSLFSEKYRQNIVKYYKSSNKKLFSNFIKDLPQNFYE